MAGVVFDSVGPSCIGFWLCSLENPSYAQNWDWAEQLMAALRGRITSEQLLLVGLSSLTKGTSAPMILTKNKYQVGWDAAARS